MCDDVQERLSRCLRLVAHLICLGLRLEPHCQLQLRPMIKSQWMNFLRIGEEPPLCSAVRHKRRDIVRALFLHRADGNIRSLPPTPPLAEGQREIGFTPLELAEGDERLVELLTEYCCTQDEVMPFGVEG